jgi:hypothetical protein
MSQPAAGTSPAAIDAAWLRLSAALTEAAADLADREDLVVSCAPGAGGGAPGCYFPPARVEIDGDHLGVDPATCDPARPSDRERYPVLWGLLAHEAAHARHSAWEVPAGGPAAAANAAIILEESRIEARQLGRRPGDRHWLRAAARTLILTGLPQAEMTAWDAGHEAALLLARVDAGVLEEDEVTAVAVAVEGVIGRDRLNRLRAIWRAAQKTADDDAAAMLGLGQRWCSVLGLDPDAPAPLPATELGASGPPSPLQEAVSAVLETVAASVASPRSSDLVKVTARAAEAAARKRSATIARKVFTAHQETEPGADSPLCGERAPTLAEQAAARRLARALRNARHRERVVITSTSPTPPGRLRMRDVVAAEAQRAAGKIPSAEPFTRTLRRHVPTPPLRLGIACDISGSMEAWAKPISSAAWILARAAAHVPDACSATVAFGAHVHPVTYPRAFPAKVREFAALDNYERFCEAVDALDGALDLSWPGSIRLLVIVSDGKFRPTQLRDGPVRIARLVKAGCAVLWLAVNDRTEAMNGAHAIAIAEPSGAADAIGQAAIRALAAAR